VIRHLSFYLSNDAILFTKLCRTLKHLLVLQKKANIAEKKRIASSSSSTDEDSKDAKIAAAAALLGASVNGSSNGANGDLNHDGTIRDDSLEISAEFEDIIADIILPSFSLMPSSMGLSSDVWSLFKEMPYQLRYRLYGYWKTSVYDKYPELIIQRADTTARTRYFRKRVAAGNVKECGRMLVKFSLNNPIIVFDLILEQIQVIEHTNCLCCAVLCCSVLFWWLTRRDIFVVIYA
jgi:hypothetical protein